MQYRLRTLMILRAVGPKLDVVIRPVAWIEWGDAQPPTTPLSSDLRRNRMAARLAAIGMSLLLIAPSLAAAQAKKAKKSRPDASSVIEIDPKGRPIHRPGEEVLFIWQDDDGWHLRAFSGGKDFASYTGTIQVQNGHVARLGGTQGLEAKGKGADFGEVSKDRKSIRFQLKLVKQGEDGFDFKLDQYATDLAFSVLVDGSDHPEKIRIGAARQIAPGKSFTLPVSKPAN
jgi:hypothetical protein